MKEARNLNQLMKHLRDDHGFSDLNGSASKIRLRNMGYFHGYKGYRFVRSASDPLPLSSFSQLESIYQFDAALKAAFYSRIILVETALKNIVLARALEACSDPSLSTFCHEALDDCKDENGRIVKARMQRNLELRVTLQNVVRSSYKSPHINHFVNRDGDAPMWSVFESMTLGNLSLLTRSLRPDIESSVLLDMGISQFERGTLADLIEVLRPFRNSIAHNGVIFDARFSQGVRYGYTGVVKTAGTYLNTCTEIGYEPAFTSIIDYVMLLSILLVALTKRKTEARRLVRECREALEDLEDSIGIDMYMKIVGSGDQQKLEVISSYISSI